MVAIHQNAGFTLVVEVGPEIDAADHVPAPLELLLKVLFYVLGCILEVSDFVFDHLHVDVLSDEQRILLHIYLHVTELYVC